MLQGLQFLAEAFDWSSRVLRFGTLIALIGLPIVLVLAWYHGERGHQRPIRSELAILALPDAKSANTYREFIEHLPLLL